MLKIGGFVPSAYLIFSCKKLKNFTKKNESVFFKKMFGYIWYIFSTKFSFMLLKTVGVKGYFYEKMVQKYHKNKSH